MNQYDKKLEKGVWYKNIKRFGCFEHGQLNKDCKFLFLGECMYRSYTCLKFLVDGKIVHFPCVNNSESSFQRI